MTESRQQANQAALEVPNIQEKVAAAEESINSITEELTVASDRAKEARDMAQQAQKEYAEKASEVMIPGLLFPNSVCGIIPYRMG